MASKQVKPVVMWGWTNYCGDVMCCDVSKKQYGKDHCGGTRIRVVVTPAKKPAKKNPGPQLVASLKDLRDTLRSGKPLASKYATTTYVRTTTKPAKKGRKK